MQDTRIVQILGVRKRSGTNFLYDLLRHHPQLRPNDRISEDNILSAYHHIENFLTDVTKRWSTHWDPENRTKAHLRAQFGKAYRDFFISEDDQGLTDSGECPKFVVTKTPSVENLHLFPRLPDSKAIVLIRDGRSVVESAMQTFGTGFRHETRAWVSAARMIRNCKENGTDFLLIKYENLYLNTEHELRRVFSFLNIETNVYPFDRAKNSPVIGSCKEGKIDGKVSWRPVEKPADFNPLQRWQHWSVARHLYFHAVAGTEMAYFGYDSSLNLPGNLRQRLHRMVLP